MNEMLDWSGLTAEGIPAFRAQLLEAGDAADPVRPDPRTVVERRVIPGPAGAPPIRLRIQRPAGVDGVLPCIYRIHGGGLIIGSPDDDHPSITPAVTDIGCVLISLSYRLAPEHPHPAQIDDCMAGLAWVAEHAAELGIDPDRIVVAGESAGGGLAAALSLLARDRGGPRIAFQYLIYPMLDDRNSTPSSYEFTGRWPGWPREMNELAWRVVLGEAAGGPGVSPYAAPARATDLSGLPPAYIDCAGLEVFRDEILDYAHRLMQSGVAVESHCWPGVFHGWELVSPEAPVTVRAQRVRHEALRRALHP